MIGIEWNRIDWHGIDWNGVDWNGTNRVEEIETDWFGSDMYGRRDSRKWQIDVDT